ncbi:MAG: glycosyltransferase, partial [Acidobacteriota bacterium]
MADVVDEGLVKISGWAFHPQEPVEELTLQINGSSVACRYGLPREDIGARFPAVPQSDHCGFQCQIALSDDGGVVKLKARLRSGAIVLSEPGKTIQLVQGRARTFLENLDRERARLLSFPISARPTVSIVIAVYNEIEVTLACLRSILRHTVEVDYEVILVDDHSSASTSSILQCVPGLHLLTNETNEGFLRSCNKAAALARGQYLLFLNNDAEVTQGWLTEMLNTLALNEGAGMVGAKLVYPDGRLQEAGSILWRDASGCNYGKGDDADKPEYNFLREVDYCSGACVLISSKLFHELGGFDPIFTPAYYEDTDLAFKVRKSGRKVYYQPRTVVVHHEGKTSGTSTDSGVKSYQLVNQEKFRSKWESVLAEAAIGRPDELRRASQRGATKRVLVVDTRVPCQDQDSGSLRMVKLLDVFGELGFHVTFAPYNRQRVQPYTDQLQRSGIECLYEPFFESFESLLSTRGSEFNLILLSRAEIAGTLLPLCQRLLPSTPIIFDTVDLHFVRHRREAELTGDEKAHDRAEKMEEMELRLAGDSTAVLVVSAEEKEVLAAQIPRQRIAVVSNIHEPFASIAPCETRHGLLFIGGFEHTPNVDAMLWFCQEIMPRILAQLPETMLHIVGSKMPESISGLASKSVVTHGFVKNVESFFESCLLSVAPLRFGAGVKGKINQSMSHGLPVVSTSIGIEGMHLTHEEACHENCTIHRKTGRASFTR